VDRGSPVLFSGVFIFVLTWAKDIVLVRGQEPARTEPKAAGLSGCCPDQVADSALRYRVPACHVEWVMPSS
jgi:hypothetical protein